MVQKFKKPAYRDRSARFQTFCRKNARAIINVTLVARAKFKNPLTEIGPQGFKPFVGRVQLTRMESSNSLDSENSQEGEMGTPEHSNLACAQSRLFSQEVTDFLESLYRHE